MLTAIGFDDQVEFDAEEIGDVGADGYLTFEFQAQQAMRTEEIPQALFGGGLIRA